MTEKRDFRLFNRLSSLEMLKDACSILNAQPTNAESGFQTVRSKKTPPPCTLTYSPAKADSRKKPVPGT
jgi:hypothetical protein